MFSCFQKPDFFSPQSRKPNGGGIIYFQTFLSIGDGTLFWDEALVVAARGEKKVGGGEGGYLAGKAALCGHIFAFAFD